ncbi:MAG TPA: hypothetical protein VFV96_06680 [Verrucomicrobiae bacterium]|nr:hypothetical protein [Verrucomicrobiae bacterium]
MRIVSALALAALCVTARATEKHFNFSELPAGSRPKGFSSLVSGSGQPGDWQIVLDEVPPLLAPLTPQAPSVSRHAVLAQLAQDPTDEHFPLLVFDGESFGDFTLSTRLKMVGGKTEQMAGIAFRIQDPTNFYVIRASALGRNVRFYKVVNGLRSVPIGPELDVKTGVWHELKIECRGNSIRADFDGREVIPRLTDTSFTAGKIGFWTKSDAVSYFTDTVITYTPKVPLAQTLVQSIMEKYPRIQALRIYTLAGTNADPTVIASNEPADVGTGGGKYERECIQQAKTFYAKTQGHVEIVKPLRDRNGDPIAAVRIHLESFPGQTEENALMRTLPIMKLMQARVQLGRDLAE